jgi:hypothetical protein
VATSFVNQIPAGAPKTRSISLAPGFSPVFEDELNDSRFNGFEPPGKAAKAAGEFSFPLTPG